MKKPDYENHGGDRKWWVENGYAIQRNDWIPVAEVMPPLGTPLWLTVEIELGHQRWVDAGKLTERDIKRSVKKEHPYVVAWMPFEADPEPYEGE